MRYVTATVLTLFLTCAAVQAYTPRERLLQAAQVSQQLYSTAKADNDPVPRYAALVPAEAEEGSGFSSLEHPAVGPVPRVEHLRRYEIARPWTRQYKAGYLDRCPVGALTWPTASDAPALRRMLADTDSGVRALAAEALATLHDPQDVPLIAKLLGDTAEAPPFVGWNDTRNAVFFDQVTEEGPLRLDLSRGWRLANVGDYAQRALLLMTGHRLDARLFPAWWQRNSNARHSLWYWQERLQRQMDRIDDTLINEPRMDIGPESLKATRDWHTWRDSEVARRRSAVRLAAERELRELPPEVEAKVKLLAANTKHYTMRDQFFQMPLSLRLGSQRLLDAMDREKPWTDVDWDASRYDLMVDRLATSSAKLFTRKDVPRLRAVLAREKDTLSSSTRASLVIGISRLLPPAEAADLDNPDTRDGSLRSAFRASGPTQNDRYYAGFLMGELVRTGLPANWQFIREAFLTQLGTPYNDYTGRSIIEALGARPLTPAKREALIDIALDKRFEPFWTKRAETMGDEVYLEPMARSINAHAGEQFISNQDENELRDPATSAVALDRVMAKVRGLRQRP